MDEVQYTTALYDQYGTVLHTKDLFCVLYDVHVITRTKYDGTMYCHTIVIIWDESLASILVIIHNNHTTSSIIIIYNII
jgi:hypothetical protein